MPLVRLAGTALALHLLLAPLASCQLSPTAGTSSDTLRVLFVGNSLTYVNDLPTVVADLGAAAGVPIATGMVARPNYALIDHLTLGDETRTEIAGGHWDVVVLQQGPTTEALYRDSLVLWTRMLDSLVRPTGARTAVYMVWPTQGQVGGFAAVRRAYSDAALAVHAEFLPSGTAWELALAADPTLPLYSPDRLHPTRLGTYLAALAIFEGLTGHDVRSLPPDALVDGAALQLPTTTIRLLQQAAHQANAGVPAP